VRTPLTLSEAVVGIRFNVSGNGTFVVSSDGARPQITASRNQWILSAGDESLPDALRYSRVLEVVYGAFIAAATPITPQLHLNDDEWRLSTALSGDSTNASSRSALLFATMSRSSTTSYACSVTVISCVVHINASRDAVVLSTKGMGVSSLVTSPYAVLLNVSTGHQQGAWIENCSMSLWATNGQASLILASPKSASFGVIALYNLTVVHTSVNVTATRFAVLQLNAATFASSTFLANHVTVRLSSPSTDIALLNATTAQAGQTPFMPQGYRPGTVFLGCVTIITVSTGPRGKVIPAWRRVTGNASDLQSSNIGSVTMLRDCGESLSTSQSFSGGSGSQTTSTTPPMTKSATIAAPVAACAFAGFRVAVLGSSSNGEVAVTASDINARGVALIVSLASEQTMGGSLQQRFTPAAAQSMRVASVADASGTSSAAAGPSRGVVAEWDALTSRERPRVVANGSLIIRLGPAAAPGVELVDTEYVRLSFGAAAFACELNAEAVTVPTAFVLQVRPSPIAALQQTQTQVQVTAGATTAAAVVTGAAAATDAQSLAALSFVSCGSAAGRAASNTMGFLLRLFSVGSSGLAVEEAGILGNVVLLVAFAALQLTVAAVLRIARPRTFTTWRAVFTIVRFPALTLAATQMQLSGTSLFTLSLLFRGKVSAPALIGLVVVVLQPVALYAVVRRTVTTTFVPTEDTMKFHAYTTWRRSVPWVRSGSAMATRVWRVVGPVGKWGPKEATMMYGAAVSPVRSAWTVFCFAPTIHTLTFNVFAAMPVPPGPLCTAQYALLAVASLAVPVTAAVMRPYRVPVVALFRLASSLGLAVALGANAYLAAAADDVSPTALKTLGAGAAVVTVVAIVETVHDLVIKFLEKFVLDEDGSVVPFLESRQEATEGVEAELLSLSKVRSLNQSLPHLSFDTSTIEANSEL
jgi:hypothetical protein